jgi:hypothetical protein
MYSKHEIVQAWEHAFGKDATLTKKQKAFLTELFKKEINDE